MIPWYIVALGAALVWGLHYPLIDFALRRVSLVSVLLLIAAPSLLLGPLFWRQLVADARTFVRLGTSERWLIACVAITSLIATVLLLVSIERKNATLAGLIEISYPNFIVLFTWLLFRQIHLTWTSAVGGLLIMAGAAIVIAGGRGG